MRQELRLNAVQILNLRRREKGQKGSTEGNELSRVSVFGDVILTYLSLMASYASPSMS
jgi:hypothetical protein